MVTVTVAATGLALATFTELVTAHVAGLTAPEGIVVTAHVKLTVPVNPPLGDTLMVDVLPVVAPAATVMFPPLLSAKLGAVVTVTVFDPEAVR